MDEKKKNSPFVLTLEDRKILSITDVDEVLSFDDTVVNLSVCKSSLTVTGLDLSVRDRSVQNGKLTITGNINSVVFTDDLPKKSIFRRLFG